MILRYDPDPSPAHAKPISKGRQQVRYPKMIPFYGLAIIAGVISIGLGAAVNRQWLIDAGWLIVALPLTAWFLDFALPDQDT